MVIPDPSNLDITSHPITSSATSDPRQFVGVTVGSMQVSNNYPSSFCRDPSCCTLTHCGFGDISAPGLAVATVDCRWGSENPIRPHFIAFVDSVQDQWLSEQRLPAGVGRNSRWWVWRRNFASEILRMLIERIGRRRQGCISLVASVDRVITDVEGRNDAAVPRGNQK